MISIKRGEIMFRQLLLLLLMLISFNGHGQTKVLLLGLDGLGGHFLSPKVAPQIFNIIQESAYSLNMQNTLPSWSATNWYSMFTSTATNVHSIKGNLQRFPKNGPPTYLEFATSQNSSFRALSYYSWKNLNDIVGKGDRINKFKQKNDDEVLEKLLNTIANDEMPDFTFAYFQGVDYAGHTQKWGSPAYFQAIKEVDVKIGSIVKALKQKGLYNKIYIVLSADHGGIKLIKPRSNLEHGGDRKTVRAIPFIINGPGIKPGPITEEVRIFDIVPTIARVQGYKKFPDGWIGRVIESAFFNYNPVISSAPLELVMSTTLKVKLQNKRGKNFNAFKPLAISRKKPFFPFGDVIIVDDRSTTKVVMAPLEPGKTAHPIAFEKVLNTRKSIANPHDFTVFTPIGPFGYVCPGEVLVPDITTVTPNTKEYICIHQSFLNKVNSIKVWDSFGQMQSKYGISFWSPIENKQTKYPLKTFYSRRHKRDRGLDRGYQLDPNKVYILKY